MVREILYKITQDTKGVLPATKQWGGMQYENDATNVIFDLSALGNINALYRIDFNTSSNGYNPSENLTCTDGKISRKIPYSVTKQGGEIQITAVITFLDENGSQTGVCYSYPVFAFLTAVAKGEETAQEIENNISVIEQSVQNMYSEIQRIGAETEINSNNAVNAAEQTVNAKFALENGAEFIFLGGNASNTSNIELVIDSELSENSSNAIQNKAVANEFKKYTPTTEADNNYVSSLKYSSDKIEYFNNKQLAEIERSEIKNKLGEIKDYIVEQGAFDIWTYRKWNSGLAECWGHLSGQTTGGYLTVNFPFQFISFQTANVSEAYGMEFGYVIYSQPTSTHINLYVRKPTEPNEQPEGINVGAFVHCIGKWK